jgi:para-aminobenzoate synthetase component 1
MRARVILSAPWRDPVEVLSAFAEEPFAIGMISGGRAGRWSYVARAPERVLILNGEDGADPFAAMGDLLGAALLGDPDGPPFQGGLAGLCGYGLGADAGGLALGRHEDWPELACGLYLNLLAFDHDSREVLAIGRGADRGQAQGRAEAALAWLSRPSAPARSETDALAESLKAEPPGRHLDAVADVVARIGRGEIFQANIARRWRGWLAEGARPIDLLRRLATASPAPFAAYLRLKGRALVSNSPEQFIGVQPAPGGLEAQTRPIKGTLPRGRDAAEDSALAGALAASIKDRAENLMIVDLMRNDLSRVCAPGTVRAPRLFEVEGFANVHHLISTVTGRLAPGRTAMDLLRACHPPGSITGAPKIQAMKVIATLEAPRGPFFGAMIWAGFDGAMDSSVLIRTCACVEDDAGWRIELRAGGGVVADSDPAAELAETEAKAAALVGALMGRNH